MSGDIDRESRKTLKNHAKSMLKDRTAHVFAGILLVRALLIAAVCPIIIALALAAPEAMPFVILWSVIPFAVSLPVYAAKTVFCLGFTQNGKPSIKEAFFSLQGINRTAKATLVRLIFIIKVVLCFLLFVVPGIICAYRNRFAIHIAADRPDLSVSRCFTISKQLMRGHCFQLLVSDLSFVGWYILAPFTLGLLYIWLLPYRNTVNNLIYLRLREEVFPSENADNIRASLCDNESVASV